MTTRTGCVDRPCYTRAGILLLSAGLACLPHGLSYAQNFPVKPVRWIVATPPGGGADILSRALGQKLTERWGQAIVVENRGGAGGIIGMEAAARAAPDGYTMLMGTTNFTINAAIRDKLPYDTLRDFAPITLIANQPFLFLIHPSIPARTLREFIAFAKSRPGQINYASTGTGGGQHMSMELLKTMTGIDLVHVPYKGSAPGTADLISGQVQATLASVLTAGEYDIKQQIAAQGADIVGSSQEEFAQRIRTEIPNWKKLIADAKIRPD